MLVLKGIFVAYVMIICVMDLIKSWSDYVTFHVAGYVVCVNSDVGLFPVCFDAFSTVFSPTSELLN